jgi:uncharacterized membrane protein YgaE (UPF0421/DUF939 family)
VTVESIKVGPTWQWIVGILLTMVGVLSTITVNRMMGDQDKIVQLQLDVSAIKSDLSYMRRDIDAIRQK